MEMPKATFAAGCFWGVEAAFRQFDGVTSTAVGYTGGRFEAPTYEELLDVFWNVHDPTQLDRQGPDIGTQYRSAIFFHDPGQEAAARASKARLRESGRFRKDVVTEIAAAGPFYLAEDYHQQYFEKRMARSRRWF
jgi:peptide-methionine (S)-S-oxide reductase